MPHRAFSYGAFYLLAFFNPVSSLRVNTGWGHVAENPPKIDGRNLPTDMEKMQELVIVN